MHGKGVGNCLICPPKTPLIGRIWREKEWDKQTGLRIFHCLLDGYQAAVYDVRVKCSGNSHSKLGKDATLQEMCISCSISGTHPATSVARFLRRALNDDSITEHTPISFFGEG